MIGPFAAEALIFAETGAAAGAIQIAGTARETQIPFFVLVCDYVLIAEEMFAASALATGDAIYGSIPRRRRRWEDYLNCVDNNWNRTLDSSQSKPRSPTFNLR